jgi:hypothetical protein
MEDTLIINKGIAMWGFCCGCGQGFYLLFSLSQAETNLTIDGGKHVIG